MKYRLLIGGNGGHKFSNFKKLREIVNSNAPMKSRLQNQQVILSLSDTDIEVYTNDYQGDKLDQANPINHINVNYQDILRLLSDKIKLVDTYVEQFSKLKESLTNDLATINKKLDDVIPVDPVRKDDAKQKEENTPDNYKKWKQNQTTAYNNYITTVTTFNKDIKAITTTLTKLDNSKKEYEKHRKNAIRNTYDFILKQVKFLYIIYLDGDANYKTIIVPFDPTNIKLFDYIEKIKGLFGAGIFVFHLFLQFDKDILNKVNGKLKEYIDNIKPSITDSFMNTLDKPEYKILTANYNKWLSTLFNTVGVLSPDKYFNIINILSTNNTKDIIALSNLATEYKMITEFVENKEKEKQSSEQEQLQKENDQLVKLKMNAYEHLQQSKEVRREPKMARLAKLNKHRPKTRPDPTDNTKVIVIPDYTLADANTLYMKTIDWILGELEKDTSSNQTDNHVIYRSILETFMYNPNSLYEAIEVFVGKKGELVKFSESDEVSSDKSTFKNFLDKPSMDTFTSFVKSTTLYTTLLGEKNELEGQIKEIYALLEKSNEQAEAMEIKQPVIADMINDITENIKQNVQQIANKEQEVTKKLNAEIDTLKQKLDKHKDNSTINRTLSEKIRGLEEELAKQNFRVNSLIIQNTYRANKVTQITVKLTTATQELDQVKKELKTSKKANTVLLMEKTTLYEKITELTTPLETLQQTIPTEVGSEQEE